VEETHKQRLASMERANRQWEKDHLVEGKATWPSQVLWQKADRNRYRRDRQFRNDFLNANSWKRLHLAEIAEVKERTAQLRRMQIPIVPRYRMFTKEEQGDSEGFWYREEFGVDQHNNDPLEEEP